MEFAELFNRLLNALVAIVLGIGAMTAFYYGANALIERTSDRTKQIVRPWIFAGPALFVLIFFLVYPMFNTLYLSFTDDNPRSMVEFSVSADVREEVVTEFESQAVEGREVEVTETDGTVTITGVIREGRIGDFEEFIRQATGADEKPEVEIVSQETFTLDNYEWAVTDENMLESFRNNLLWLILVPTFSTALGLVIAILADRVRWENIAKALIFMPLAISFVGASVIWRFIYYFRPEGEDQIGLLNAIVTSFGGDPVSWLTNSPGNNFALIIIMIWMQTGFAMVILSSALKGVPEETLEAARIDGAGEIRIFFNIIIPQIASTILVVITTIIILVLKVFDIPYVMTSGEHGTEVLANVMYRQMMVFRDYPRGSVAAVILMLAVVPIMIYNIRRFRQEEALR